MLLRDGLSNELDRCVYPVSRNELLLGFEGASGNRATILSRGYSRWEKYSLKCWEESNWNGETTVTRLKDSSRARERICIYIYICIFTGHLVRWTIRGNYGRGTKDWLYRCEVYYRREISPT